MWYRSVLSIAFILCFVVEGAIAAPGGAVTHGQSPRQIRRAIKRAIAGHPAAKQQVRLARREHSRAGAEVLALGKARALPPALLLHFAQPELQARLLAPYRRRSIAAAAKAEVADRALRRGRQRFNYLAAELAARCEGRDSAQFEQWARRQAQSSAAIWPHFELATALYELGKRALGEGLITRKTFSELEQISGWKRGWR